MHDEHRDHQSGMSLYYWIECGKYKNAQTVFYRDLTILAKEGISTVIEQLLTATSPSQASC
jgi:hypothetical protein